MQQWVIDGYTLMFAALLLFAGNLADRVGAKRSFGVGIAAFLVASAACALAPTTGALIGARFVQGAAAAVRQVMETVASGVDAVYVTVDIDVVNGSEARGTGAPVFAGIEARTFLEMMEVLSTYDIIRAIDLCEVAPGLDPAGTTADLAVAGLLTLLERRLGVTCTPS